MTNKNNEKKGGIEMTSAVAERAIENIMPKTYEVSKLVSTGERDIITELAETEEIKRLRSECKDLNERLYDEDILSFAVTLSGVCDQKVYEGKEAAVYFEILDTRDFLLKKFKELPVIESAKYKDKIEPFLQEAEEELMFFENIIFKK